MDAELRERIRRRYVRGAFGYSQVAREFGVSDNTVRRVVDPEYEERQRRQSREAKRRRTGICEVCGGKTRYTGHHVNGPSKICAGCQQEKDMATRVWTREAIIAAIQRWVREHGELPRAHPDWTRAGKYWPSSSNVYRSKHSRHHPFASWADAIEAAGFPRPKLGRRSKKR